MKLRNWMKNLTQPLFFQRPQSIFPTINCGQDIPGNLQSPEPYMPLSSVRRVFVCFCLGLFLGSAALSRAQTNYYTSYGTEYSIIGALPGDQTYPSVAFNKNGGYVVWQDNITDPSGLGISAMKLTSTLSPSGGAFAVNMTTSNDQVNARVTLLKNGGAAFVWQGGPNNNQHIYSRFLNASNQWLNTIDMPVSSYANSFQEEPAVATLTNGDVIVVWSSFNQASPNSLDDIYGQLVSSNGIKIGPNFLINVYTNYNQQSPTVAALTNGGFVVAWASEQQRSSSPDWGTNTQVIGYGDISSLPSSDIYERQFSVSGTTVTPSTGEILVDQSPNPCSAPAVATAADGSYMVTWCAMTLTNSLYGWDIYARSFTNSSGGPVLPVNSTLYGDQYNPQISAIGGEYLIVWTSMGQDGSREGVFAQFVNENWGLIGKETRMNTTTLGQQMQPTVASDGANEFLTVWTGFTFGPNSLDLFAQRYANAGAEPLQPMPAPYVLAPFILNSNGVYQPELIVSWAPVQGLSVSNYQVYVNGSATPAATVTGDSWTMTAADGLTASSTNTFATAYVTSQGFVSPATTNATWSGQSWGGIPYEWMASYFGGYYGTPPTYHTNGWPSPNGAPPGSPLDSPTLMQLFLMGGIPYDPSTWLHMTLTRTQYGMTLKWNTEPGMTYQIQTTSDFKNWANLGPPRFETDTSDSTNLVNSSGSYFRVELLQP
jgi:hypothetical protein